MMRIFRTAALVLLPSSCGILDHGGDCYEHECSALGAVGCYRNDTVLHDCRALLERCERNWFDPDLWGPMFITCRQQSECEALASGRPVSCESPPGWGTLGVCVCN